MSTEPRENEGTLRNFKVVFSAAIYISGLLLALLVTLMSMWPDLEASMFNPGLPQLVAKESLRSLRCPLFITPDEEGTISATFENPIERPVRYSVRATIAEEYVTLMRQVDSQIDLDVGEKQELSWSIFAEDAAFDRVVLARVYFPRVPQVEGKQKACGVLLLPFSGLTGNQYAVLFVTLSLLGMGIGAGWWWWQKRPISGRTRDWARAFGILGCIVLAGLILSILGSWALTILSLTLLVLYLGAMLEHFYFSKL